MKDLVVGAITGYNFDAIVPWVLSLEKSGFTGDKVMFCYNISYDVCNKLSDRGFKIIGFGKNDQKGCLEYPKNNFNIVVERFANMSKVLRTLGKYRYIISTDVKDVVFQRNPSEWLENNIGKKKIVASSESIRYEDENWGRDNLLRSFGADVYEYNRSNVISNAGVMAGDYNTMIDLFMNIAIYCDAAPSHSIDGGGGPDQAAYNVLINSAAWKSITRFTPSEDGWSAQLGTTGPQIYNRYGSLLVESAPSLHDDVVCTSTGDPFYIVHQYDRVPEWRENILRKYR